MKLSTLFLATSMIVAPAVAFAQSAPAPANSSGPNVSPSVQAPTDQASEGDNATGIPSRPSGSLMAPDALEPVVPMNRSTTGSGIPSSSNPGTPESGVGAGSTQDYNLSPNEKANTPAEALQAK